MIKKYKIKRFGVVFIIIAFLLGCCFIFYERTNSVDLVVAWVDGGDQEWRKKKLYWLSKNSLPQDINGVSKCRFADNDELKYLLRSVELYAPWIRKIFIVTDNQAPKWLNTNHPKIRIVDHKEIIPAKFLPTFNSTVIEAYLPFIPGLSEKFLYANDDTMFNTVLTKEFFYNKDGYPIVRMKYKLPDPPEDLYAKTLNRVINLVMDKYSVQLEKRLPHHNIDAYLKSTFLKCRKEFKKEYEKCAGNRFRTENDISRFLVSCYGIAIGKAVPKVVAPSESLILIPNWDCEALLAKRSPKLFCINDNENTTDIERKNIKVFLEKRFPNKSRFEL
ncbi:MAG: hypothetical protein LBM19_02490 [Holosporales bacterium]|nr:hypothetical protein [Holosporales bacterium]